MTGSWRTPKPMNCPFCSKKLYIPPTGNRADAMIPHLPECPGPPKELR